LVKPRIEAIAGSRPKRPIKKKRGVSPERIPKIDDATPKSEGKKPENRKGQKKTEKGESWGKRAKKIIGSYICGRLRRPCPSRRLTIL